MTPREVDVHTLPAMLTALRLPSFGQRWRAFAAQADGEGWPAARFLAALAECELAERETRRIQRHLHASRLPGGKTLATFDVAALPGVPRRRIEALAAGDWLETGANLIAIGNSGAGKTHTCSAPSATPWSRPATASSTPAPPTSCRGSRPRAATSPARARSPSSPSSTC
jgi:DNA replication protein DnaC